jgi:hypothetical protein
LQLRREAVANLVDMSWRFGSGLVAECSLDGVADTFRGVNPQLTDSLVPSLQEMLLSVAGDRPAAIADHAHSEL